jgi:beta-aspartyl-peptidase (threonine type)
MTHRSIRFLFVFVFLATTLATAQDDLKAVRKLLDDQVQAWNEGDVEGYMKGYWNSDSTTFVSGGTVVKGYAGVLARYKKSYNTREKMGTLSFEELALRQPAAALIIATGIWKLQRTKDKPWGRFTLLIEKKPEGWRIVYDHTSSAN